MPARALRDPRVLGPALTAVISIVGAALALRAWQWRPGIPLGLTQDTPFVLMQIKEVVQHGWYGANPDLGWPGGQDGWLFPELNIVHVLAIKVLSVFSSEPSTLLAVYFFLGFPLAGLAMYWLARTQDLSTSAAVMAGSLFALSPGHQDRFPHLWLASYWTVPFGVWLALEIYRGTIGERVRSPAGLLGVGAAILVTGLSGVYYVAFVLIVIGTAALARMVNHGWRSGLPGLGVTLGVVLTFAVPLGVALWRTRSIELTGPRPGIRPLSHTEMFSGKLIDLLLPWRHHRISELHQLTSSYNSALNARTFESVALGLVAAFGLVILMAAVFVAVLSRTSRVPTDLRLWAVLALACFAFYTVGGLNSLFSVVLTTQIRTWSRIFLLIMLFGLLAVGYGLTRLGRRHGPRVAGALATLLIVGGVIDQTNPDRAPNYAANADLAGQFRDYASDIVAATDEGCAVFQLPVINFPESGLVHELWPYDQVRTYAVADGLTWSAGAIRSTTAQNQISELAQTPVPELFERLRDVGYCALEVSEAAYADEDEETRSPTAELREHLGPPIATVEGTLTAFAL
ncbi:MAG: hypothetical protein Q4G67_11060 [Actinomycetia bacterium]|nr:hypothetical protein [Actinomycetes bacterium]